MNRVVKPLLRIGFGTVLVLAVLMAVLFFFVRLPSLRTVDDAARERSDPARLKAHVRFFSETVMPRNTSHLDNLNAAAEYIERALRRYGGVVTRQPYTARGAACRNIRARFGPASGALLVVGAHYDGFGDLPAADDNASGAAGLLELGRLLGMQPPPMPVELVAFSTEEPPFFGGSEMGSAVHAEALHTSGVSVRGMICLEMIGYFTERQPAPHWIMGLLYPRRGDFITVVGRWKDRDLVRRVKAGIKGAGGVRVCSYTGPVVVGADLSDHRNYWRRGYPAVMVTDTAFIRNPNYHTAGDRAGTLDYRLMAGVVDGVFNAVLHF